MRQKGNKNIKKDECKKVAETKEMRDRVREIPFCNKTVC